MRDPLVRAGIGKSMVWNINRRTHIALIQAGINPGIEPDADGFYTVSYHNTHNGAYAVQNRVRTEFPSLRTRVKYTDKDDCEWNAVIQVKLMTSDEAA